MALDLGDLKVTLGANTREFNRSLDAAGGRLRSLGTQMRSGINMAGKYGAAMAAAGAAILAHLVKNAIAGAREVQNLSRVADASSEAFQRQAYAVRTVGIEKEKYADILKDMKDRVGDFISTGAGPMADFFERVAPKVGVTAEQFRKLSGPDALQLYVDSLEKANLSQSEMTFYMEALASDSTMLLPLLRDGGREMRRLGDEAERTGNVLSDIDLETMVQAEEAIHRASQAVEGLVNELAVELAPFITIVADELVNASAQGQGFGKSVVDSMESGVKAVGIFADGLRGVHVLAKMALLGFQGLGTGILSVFSLITEGWARIIGGVLSGVDTLVTAFNALPGPDIPTDGLRNLRDEFENTADSTRAARERMIESTKQTAAETQALLMKPIPSKGFNDAFDRIQAKAQEMRDGVAKTVEEARNAAGANRNRSGMTGLGEEQNSERQRAEREAREQAMQDRLDRIRESLATEKELEMEAHAERLEFLQEALGSEYKVEADVNALIEDEKRRHELTMREIQIASDDALLSEHQRFLQAMVQADKQQGAARVATMSGAFAEITAAGSRHSKELFRVNQIAGIANATVSTFQGAAKALEWGWPMGPVFAAAIVANGMAQVKAISSQSFEGGGSGAAPSVNAGASAPPVDTGAAQGGGGRRSQTLTLDMRGGDDNSRKSIRSIMEQINEYIDDGGDIGRLVVK